MTSESCHLEVEHTSITFIHAFKIITVITILGHGDNTSKDEPTLIEALKDKDIIDIECGGMYR